MKYFALILSAALVLISCGQSNNKQKELELKEKELEQREKELEVKEKSNNPGNTEITSVKIQEDEEIPSGDVVSIIDAEVKGINSLSLIKKTFKFTDFCNQPFTIDYFFSGDEIVMIVAKSEMKDSEAAGSRDMVFYYKNRKFIYSYENFEHHLIKDGTKGPRTGIYKVYSDNDKVVSRTKNGTSVKIEDELPPGAPESIKKASEQAYWNISPNSLEYQIFNAFSTQDFKSLFCS